MSHIDEVIARSRRGAGGGGRHTFQLARAQAITKLRQFALADPSFYVLELIQAAAACQAANVNIDFDRRTALVAWSGRALRREELAHLFDYLFTARDRLEVAHLRALALGVNALFVFAPEQVVIESGDGTRANTHRVVIDGDAEVATLGPGAEPLSGSYVLATGLRRRRAANLGLAPVGEQVAIEDRCLCATVPILVNGEAPFGYSRQRVPRLWGFSPQVEIDEGDLYGSIGVCPWAEPLHFRLLTHGVWIESVEYPLIPGAKLGGVVSFDRLRKTADHGGIVRDDVYEELWIRLRPYAQQLVGGFAVPTIRDVRLASGEAIPPPALRGWLQGQRRVVLADPDAEEASRQAAGAVAAALAAPLVTVPAAERRSLHLLAGPQVDLVEPTGTAAEVAFYRQAELGPPAEPYLAPPLALPPVLLGDAGPSAATLAAELGAAVRIEAMLYVPAAPPTPFDGVLAEVLVADRLVWEGELPSAFVGQRLQVRLTNVAVARLLDSAPPSTGRDRRARELAEWVLTRAREQQVALHTRTVETLAAPGAGLGEAARRLALRLLSRNAVVRLRGGEVGGPPRVSIAWLNAGPDLLDAPLFVTLAGERLTPRQLVAQMARTHGLVYGVIPEVPADLVGLDRRLILALDQHSERSLTNLVGEAAYVRVDGRDRLAEQAGVQVRDLAVGLRRYPAFPLWVEGANPSRWPAAQRRACLTALVQQLTDRFLGRAPAQPSSPTAFVTWEENRRQACRHLQAFAAAAMACPELDGVATVLDLPLFFADDGGTLTPRQLATAFTVGALTLVYSGALAARELGTLAAAAASGAAPAPTTSTRLAASPFVAHLLSRVGRVRVAFDFDVDDREGAPVPDASATPLLVQADLCDEWVTGSLGIPHLVPADPAIVLVDPDGHTRRVLPEPVGPGALVGCLRLRRAESGGPSVDQLAAAIDRTREHLVAKAFGALTEGAASDRRRLEELLLAYAGDQLLLSADPFGVVTASVRRPLALDILNLPLFPAGEAQAATGWRLVREFAALGSAAAGGPTALRRVLAHTTAAHLRSWLTATLSERRVSRLPSTRFGVPADERRAVANAAAYLERLNTWWTRLCRQTTAGGQGPIVVLELSPGPLSAVATESGSDPAAPLGRLDLDRGALLLDRYHWLVREAFAHTDDLERLGWLLLAAFALVNARLTAVTNDQELLFQLAVARAIADPPGSVTNVTLLGSPLNGG